MKTSREWIKLLEERRQDVEDAITEAYKTALVMMTSSVRSGVLLWEDGAVSTYIRDFNTFSIGEHVGSAIKVYSTHSLYDADVRKDFDSDSDSEYIDHCYYESGFDPGCEISELAKTLELNAIFEESDAWA